MSTGKIVYTPTCPFCDHEFETTEWHKSSMYVLEEHMLEKHKDDAVKAVMSRFNLTDSIIRGKYGWAWFTGMIKEKTISLTEETS